MKTISFENILGESSANDVDSPVHTLIEHWDGKKWSVVLSPDPANEPNDWNWNELDGVAALSATDAWAVGEYHNKTKGWEVLTEHWDGKQWSIVVGSYPSTALYGMGRTGEHVWAVGVVRQGEPTDDGLTTVLR